MPPYRPRRGNLSRAQSPGGRLGRLIQTGSTDLAAFEAARQDLVVARILDTAESSLEEHGVELRPEHVAQIVTFLAAHTSHPAGVPA